MAYRFEDIPIDIIINHIGNNISFTDVANLTLVSKNLRTNIKSNSCHLITNIISNNYAFDYYKKELEIDIISDIKKSALSFLQFEETFDAIRNNDVSSISFEFDKNIVDTSTASINATFKIFQMFVLETESLDKELSFAFIDAFTKSIHKYFRALFQARNKISQYDESSCIHNILNKSEKNGWHKVNINVYYLYENYTLLKVSKRSHMFKSYIQNDTNIVISNYIKNNTITMVYLIALMSSGKVQEKLYCFHEIMKLLNFIYAHKAEKKCFLEEYQKLTTTCLRKIHEFRMYIIENSRTLPLYFRQYVFVEYDRFIELVNTQ